MHFKYSEKGNSASGGLNKNIMEQKAYKISLEGWVRCGPVEMTRNRKGKQREVTKHGTCEKKLTPVITSNTYQVFTMY